MAMLVASEAKVLLRYGHGEVRVTGWGSVAVLCFILITVCLVVLTRTRP